MWILGYQDVCYVLVSHIWVRLELGVAFFLSEGFNNNECLWILFFFQLSARQFSFKKVSFGSGCELESLWMREKMILSVRKSDTF